MSNWNPIESWEKLRTKTGEYLPVPAVQRLYIVSRSLAHVRNCTQSGDVNYIRNSAKGRRIADAAINPYLKLPEAPNSNSTSQAAKVPEDKTSDTPNRQNADLLKQAYEEIDRIRGGENAQ